MFDSKQKKMLFAILVATLVLSLVVIIPFGVGTVSSAEVIVKYYVCGGLFVGLSVFGLVLRYKYFEPANKYLTLKDPRKSNTIATNIISSRTIFITRLSLK